MKSTKAKAVGLKTPDIFISGVKKQKNRLSTDDIPNITCLTVQSGVSGRGRTRLAAHSPCNQWLANKIFWLKRTMSLIRCSHPRAYQIHPSPLD